MGGKDFQIAGLWVQPLVNIPEIWYLAWQPGDLPPKGRNVARLDDPAFTKAFYTLQTDSQPREEVLREVELALEQNPPAAPLYRRKEGWLVSERFEWRLGPVIAIELWAIRPRAPH